MKPALEIDRHNVLIYIETNEFPASEVAPGSINYFRIFQTKAHQKTSQFIGNERISRFDVAILAEYGTQPATGLFFSAV